MRKNMIHLAALAAIAAGGNQNNAFDMNEEPDLKYRSKRVKRMYALTPKQIKKRAAAKMAKKSRKINYNKNK